MVPIGAAVETYSRVITILRWTRYLLRDLAEFVWYSFPTLPSKNVALGPGEPVDKNEDPALCDRGFCATVPFFVIYTR